MVSFEYAVQCLQTSLPDEVEDVIRSLLIPGELEFLEFVFNSKQIGKLLETFKLSNEMLYILKEKLHLWFENSDEDSISCFSS